MRCWIVAFLVVTAGCNKSLSDHDSKGAASPSAAGTQEPSGATGDAKVPDLSPDPAEEPRLVETLKIDQKNSTKFGIEYQPCNMVKYEIDFVQESGQTGIGNRYIERGFRQEMLVERTVKDAEPGKDGAKSGGGQPGWTEALKFHQMRITPTMSKDSAPTAVPEDSPLAKKDEDERAAALQRQSDVMAAAIMGTRFEISTDASGTLAVAAVKAKGDAPSPMAEVLKMMLSDAVVKSPGKELAPGDTWTETHADRQERVGSVAALERKVEWKVVGWLMPTEQCSKCVAVEGAGVLDSSGTLELPDLKGSFAGKSLLRYEAVLDVEHGRVEKIVMSASDLKVHDAISGGRHIAPVEKTTIRLAMVRKGDTDDEETSSSPAED